MQVLRSNIVRRTGAHAPHRKGAGLLGARARRRASLTEQLEGGTCSPRACKCKVQT